MVVAAMQGKRRKQLQIDDDDDIEFTVLGQDITTFQQQRQRGQAATSNHQRSNRNEDVARQSGGSTGQQQHTQVHNQQVRRCISGSMVYGTRGLGLFSSAVHCAAKHADAVSCLQAPIEAAQEDQEDQEAADDAAGYEQTAPPGAAGEAGPAAGMYITHAIILLVRMSSH